MKTYKRTFTSTETHEVLSIRVNLGAQPQTTTRWCEVCASETAAIPTELAAVFAGMSEALLHRLISDGLLHFQDTADGRLLICLGNLTGAQSEMRTDTENNPRGNPNIMTKTIKDISSICSRQLVNRAKPRRRKQQPRNTQMRTQCTWIIDRIVLAAVTLPHSPTGPASELNFLRLNTQRVPSPDNARRCSCEHRRTTRGRYGWLVL
jgi:hypothetical protein